MIKARKKSISLLITLVFLLSVLLPAGAAFAAEPEYAKISGSYTFVDADENQLAGTIDVVKGSDAGSPDTVYVEITLPDGVEFTSVSSVTYSTGWSKVGDSDTSLTLSTTTFPDLAVSNINLDIDSDVTGSIVADVRVWAVTGSAIVWDVSSEVTIAKVASGDVTVTAGSAKVLAVGSNKEGAKITIKELSPGALTAADPDDSNNDIILTIQASGVKWDKNAMMASPSPISTVGVTLHSVTASSFSNSDKVLRLDVKTGTKVINGKIEITPKFLVQPGASGDVVVKVSGDDVPTTELTVGKVSVGDVAVSIKNDDKDKVYLGQTATFDDVEIKLDPSIQLNDGDYITITLPKGVKWQDVTDPITSSSTKVTFNSLYNDDRSLWLDIADDESNDVKLTKLKVLADYNATVGDLEVTFGGAVEGSYKIGTVAAPFTIKADEVTFPQRGSDVAGGKIVITEAGDGALIATDNNSDKTDGAPEYLDIVLPMGVTFAKTPDVDVTEGDLDLGDVSLNDDNNVLRIKIDGKSNSASTIEITDIYYNVDNRAAVGDVIAKVGKEYNLNSSNYLASVKLGTIKSPTAAEAKLTAGSTTMIVDGQEISMDVAPYIKNDRLYVSARYCANALGVDNANIWWDGTTKTATIMKGAVVIQMTVGSKVMKVNGAAITMDTAPELVPPGRVMLPIGWLAWALGASASWDQATQTATLTTK